MFECEECGLIKDDEEKNEVIDGLTLKFVCNRCVDENKHIILKDKRKKIEKTVIEIPKITFEDSKINVDDFKRMLRMERIKRGLSIEELAKKLEIDEKDLKNFERGYNNNENIRKKLEEFFNIKKLNIEEFKED